MKWFALLAVAVISFHGTTPASAQANRTFVSGHGSDSNPCTLAAPCRSFQNAHDQTNAGGEIDVLDPGGYGPVTISKAISIQAHGFGGITASAASAVAITINAGASDRIYLSGLLLEGAGSGGDGVDFNSGAVLTIRDCSIRNFTGSGLSLTAAGSLSFVSDTVISDNYGTSAVGVFIGSRGSGLHATLSRVQILGNDVGLHASGDLLSTSGITWVSLSDSIIAGSNTQGLLAANHANSVRSFVTVTVARSSIVDNPSSAILVNGTGSVVQLNQSTIANNTSGWSTANGGAMSSWGNNAFSDFGSVGDGVMPLRNLE